MTGPLFAWVNQVETVHKRLTASLLPEPPPNPKPGQLTGPEILGQPPGAVQPGPAINVPAPALGGKQINVPAPDLGGPLITMPPEVDLGPAINVPSEQPGTVIDAAKNKGNQGKQEPEPLPKMVPKFVAREFGSQPVEQDHIEDHIEDLGYRTHEEYVQGARDLLTKSQAHPERFDVRQGDDQRIRVYDPETRQVGSYDKDGTIVTYFKGDKDYWTGNPQKFGARVIWIG